MNLLKLRQNTMHTTENFVYLMFCNKCGKQYDGKRKGPSSVWMTAIAMTGDIADLKSLQQRNTFVRQAF